MIDLLPTVLVINRGFLVWSLEMIPGNFGIDVDYSSITD